MSVKATSAVWEHSRAKGNDRLLMLALADEASDTGEVSAYRRTQAYLARKLHVTNIETVRRATRACEEMGELQVLHQGGGKSPTDYQLLLPGLGPPAPTAQGGQPPPASGGTPHRSGGAAEKRTASLGLPVVPVVAPAAGAAQPEAEPAPAERYTDTPLGRQAHRLAVLAMEQPVKPVLRDVGGKGPFAAVLALLQRLLAAGTPVPDLERAIQAGVEVWTLAGLQTAVAHARPRRRPADAGADAVLAELQQGGQL